MDHALHLQWNRNQFSADHLVSIEFNENGATPCYLSSAQCKRTLSYFDDWTKSAFCGGTVTPCFGLLVMSGLGLTARLPPFEFLLYHQ